jgi:putative membrane protein insertion efficiency factor/ribonuclease P protein component
VARPAGCPFPKTARLLARRQFLAMSRRSEQPDLTFKTGSFLVVGRSNGLDRTRLGVTVTKKTGIAVVRNRLKRQVREFFRLQSAGWPTGLDLLFIARQTAGTCPRQVIARDLERVGRQIAAAGRPGQPGGAPGSDPGSVPAGFIQRSPGRLILGLALGLIHLYQRSISPFTPPCCRFRPTCSDYAAQALETHGLGRGSLLALRRLLRCHPFYPGGYDPVPPPPSRRLVSGAVSAQEL